MNKPLIPSLLLSASLLLPSLLLTGSAYAEPLFSSRAWQAPDGVDAAIEVVHSDTRTSGGFSALWVSPNCERLITLSDYSQHSWRSDLTRSGWFEAEINFDQSGNLEGVTSIRSGQLTDLDGKIVPGAVESMGWDGRGFLISFDDRGDIYRYAGSEPSTDLFANRPVVAYQGENLAGINRGLEALTVLADGRIFALWEKSRRAKHAAAWLISGEQTEQLEYETDLNPSGATTLADGSLIILERQFLGGDSGTHVRLVHLPEKSLNGSGEVLKGSDKPLKGRTVFDVRSKLLDNFEGISACRKDGRELLFAISDNNGDWPRVFQGSNPQSTLLLMIELNR
ncbi:MAG: esterase-like activity of phytase family protein [Mariprofundaceae bacterium]